MVDEVFMNEIMDSFPDNTSDDDVEDGAVIVNNETPYRPQVGDRVRISTLFKINYVCLDGTVTVLDLDGNDYLSPGDLQLISRADGVPVESAVDLQEEIDELRKEMAEAVETIRQMSDAIRIYIPSSVSILEKFLSRHQPPSAVDTQQVNHE